MTNSGFFSMKIVTEYGRKIFLPWKRESRVPQESGLAAF